MRLQRVDPIGRAWLQDLIYYMLEEKHLDYCYTFHNIELIAVQQPFAFSNGVPILACVALDNTTERLTMLIYYPIVSRLTFNCQLVILQHEAIHIIDGHFSSYGQRLAEEYGAMISNMAMDLYVNQKLDTRPLIDNGLSPMLLSNYGYPEGLSSEDYCKLLQDDVNSGKITLPNESTVLIMEDGQAVLPDGTPVNNPPTDPQAGTVGKPGEEFTGKGQYRATEIFDLTKEEAVAADQATKELLASVLATLQERNQKWGRGFGGADQMQFIEAAKRQSVVPWFHYLRMIETKHRADIVVPTKRRLSRRSPFHLGRVRHFGLEAAFMVDTSGSMGIEQLKLVDPELRGMHARGAHIRVFHCDGAVAKVEEYNPFISLEEFHGRGGTDFSDALLKVRDMYPRPGLFVGYTDGYGGTAGYQSVIEKERGVGWWRDYVALASRFSPDGIETLWLIPEGCMSPEDFTETIAPWGTVVIIPNENVKD